MLKWKKRGLIFSTEGNLPANKIGFAQGPQAIELEDCIRVYFSTRERDNSGKFLSHVSYVDFNHSFTKIIKVNKDEVVSLGSSGCFDEHGIFPFHPLKVKNQIFAYTTGWNRKVSVSADASIGLVVSKDNGNSYERLGPGPIMGPCLQEPFLIGDPYIKHINDQFHMWYIFGTKWLTDKTSGIKERVYKIAYATSEDAIEWKRQSQPIIPDSQFEDECQAMPTVFYRNGIYHMLFCVRRAFNFRTDVSASYKIGYAYSKDGHEWTRDDKKSGLSLSSEGWDSTMMCYPNCIEVNNKVYLLYNGNEFGKHGFGLAELIEEN